MHIETLKYYIQSANVNFLYGSGLSRPFLSVLGNIEKWLTELNEKRHAEGDKVEFAIVETSILKLYFESVMYPNVAPADARGTGQWHQLKLRVSTDLKYKHAEASEEGIVHRDISCDDAWHKSSEYL